MDSSSEPRPAQNYHSSDHLANERTFLAWIRTSISVIGLGFVVSRFSVWLREISVRVNQPVTVRHSGLSLPLGVCLMIFGGVLAVMAQLRYRKVKIAIDKNQPSAAAGSTVAVAVIVVCAAIAMTVYMILSA